MLDTAAIAFAATLFLSVAARIAALHFNPIGPYFDEAQYWAWSRALDWGYFTKPPMVAWAIWSTTSLFGDAEWAVRLAAPLAHGATALTIYALARAMYGRWAGFWAGFAWLATPAVWFSSSLISTDALLLPFWALALLALHRLVTTRAWGWAALTGAAIGLGLLAKYAMLYFPICMGLAALWLPRLRASLGQGRALLIGAIAFVIVAPNLIWNAQHGFATISHTADNVNLGAKLFNIDELIEFLTSQALLIGPFVFLALVALFWRAARKPMQLTDDERFLLAFVIPPLAVVTALSFITRANGNWAVAAYVAATILIVGALLRGGFGRRWLAGALAVNIAIGGALIFAALDPDLSSQFRGVRDARSWDVTARTVAAQAHAHGPVSAIMVDDRIALYELDYYWQRNGHNDAPAPVRMWLLHGHPRIAAEAAAPMRRVDGQRVLIVHMSNDYHDLVAADFAQFRSVGEATIPLGGARTRKLTFSIGEGFAPVPRDEAFVDRLATLRGRH
jgi:4-amino-4-deoxy-L-arabinose transferase-like glycosyltransferase